MKFEEQFPSLNERRFSVYSFKPHGDGDRIGAKVEAISDFVMDVKEVAFKELSNPLPVPIPRLVLDCDIEEHCLDKKKVQDVLNKKVDCANPMWAFGYITAQKDIKKELGLEDEQT